VEDHVKAFSILLVEGSPLFRLALTTVLTRIGIVVTTCESARLSGKDWKKCDVVLIDMATFRGTDQQLTQLIQEHLKFGPALLLAREDRVDQMITGLRSGASGLVKQSTSDRDLRQAINTVASGFAWCDGDLFKLVTRYLLPVSQWQEPKLTRREEEVLRCLSLGQTNKEIAAALSVSVQSVKVYVSNLLRKTGVPNRNSLALHALARGLQSC
jgi:DNA-binding NarL/FixJ family response regulator